jgi:hypothetical protein
MAGAFLTADLGGMMNESEFGVPVTVGTGTAARVTAGIFDAGYLEASNGQVQSVGPALWMETADVAGVAMFSPLSIGTANFRVVGIEPDGTGITVLRLEIA